MRRTRLHPNAGLMVSRVDIVIVNWNAGAQLSDCLQSLTNVGQDGFQLEKVVVVDNGSNDGSVDQLPPLALPLQVIRNQENRGFAAACNQGAAVGDSDFLLFLNPDARLFPTSLSHALAVISRPEHEKTGICGVQLLDEDGRISRSCARFPTPGNMLSYILGLDRLSPRLFPSFFMADWDHAESREVDHVIGACFLVRRDLFNLLKGFDEAFFVYLEDVDFSRRAREAGYHSFYLATAQAYHKGGGTSEQVKAKRLFYSLRSRILYGYKHFGWWSATSLTVGTLAVESLIRVGHAAVRGSLGGVMETLRAYAMLWQSLPEILARGARQDSLPDVGPARL